jgi:FKBP-type peptidyl-prolyl cis-trans isomerase
MIALMRKTLLSFFLILILCSCHFKKKASPYKGYETDDSFTYYKYVDLGIKSGSIQPGQTMEVYMNYSRMNNSVFWDSRNLWYPFTILLPYDSLQKSENYRHILLKCNEGDSISFIVKRNTLYDEFFNPYNLVTDSIVKVQVRIAAILDSNQLKSEMKKYTIFAEDKEMKEEYELKRYLMLNKVPDSDNIGGIYIIPLIGGNGPKVTPKSNVSVLYRGCFMNEKTFDSVPVNDPLTFNIADSGQVIKGLEKGIKKMREGEVAKIIIPSHSAFGEKGSSTGIVPPYTTLVYEVTMVKVK